MNLVRPVAQAVISGDYPCHMIASPLFLLAILFAASVTGWAIGLWMGRRRARSTGDNPSGRAIEHENPADADAILAARDALRGAALDVTREAILVIGADGRVRDCNAAALLLFDRHRSAMECVDAVVLRELLSPGGAPLEWTDMVAMRAPWSGDAHVRLPDGSRLVCLTRMVPVFDTSGEVAALVEVYRTVAAQEGPYRDHFVASLEVASDEAPGGDPTMRAERELRLIALAFGDLESVVRQYERLLPALRAEDPMAEAIAGIAAETSEVAASANVPRLLHELPRALARLGVQVARLSRRTRDTLPLE